MFVHTTEPGFKVGDALRVLDRRHVGDELPIWYVCRLDGRLIGLESSEFRICTGGGCDIDGCDRRAEFIADLATPAGGEANLAAAAPSKRGIGVPILHQDIAMHELMRLSFFLKSRDPSFDQRDWPDGIVDTVIALLRHHAPGSAEQATEPYDPGLQARDSRGHAIPSGCAICGHIATDPRHTGAFSPRGSHPFVQQHVAEVPR